MTKTTSDQKKVPDQI